METLMVILAVILPLLSTGLVLFFLRRRMKRQKAKLGDIADGLGASFDGRALKGVYENRAYRCDYFPGSKNAPSYFKIIFEHPFPEKMRIRREGALDRFAKKIGLAAEAQTGDPMLDKECYIDAPSPEFAAAYFQRGGHTWITKDIFSLNELVTEIAFSEESLQITLSPCNLDPKIINESLVKSALPLLFGLAQDTPTELPVTAKSSTSLPPRLIPLFGIPMMVFASAGMAMLIFGLTRYKPFGYAIYFQSLKYSLPALALFLLFAFRLIKGRSSSGKWFLALAIFVPMGLITVGIGAHVFTNGYLDDAAATTRVLEVTDKFIKTSDKSTSYYITVPSWREGSVAEKMSIGNDLYDQINEGDRVEIATKPGKWGYEWFVHCKKVT